MMVRLGRTLLVLVVVVLVGLGLTLSARGINSLTLAQPPILMVQAVDDVITVQALGESCRLSKHNIQEAGQGMGRMLERQAWKSMVRMGQALADYAGLVH
ncbi:MAG: hypothetical protein ABRQ24_00860 [Syntrophomonadaceae bacterium]